MSRKIKFRAWVLKEGKMVQHRNRAPAVKMFAPDYAYTNKEVIVMQYTGLRDKNDVEIYEGDVVKGIDNWGGKDHRFIGQVKYLGTSFKVVGVKQYYGGHADLNSLFEVIGNIYENPELLKERDVR